MTIQNAIGAITGRPDLFAWRPDGTLLSLTNRQKVVARRSGMPGRWVPKYSDLVTDDWKVGDVRAVMKDFPAQPDQGAA
jgi:hypothetical protein